MANCPIGFGVRSLLWRRYVAFMTCVCTAKIVLISKHSRQTMSMMLQAYEGEAVADLWSVNSTRLTIFWSPIRLRIYQWSSTRPAPIVSRTACSMYRGVPAALTAMRPMLMTAVLFRSPVSWLRSQPSEDQIGDILYLAIYVTLSSLLCLGQQHPLRCFVFFATHSLSSLLQHSTLNSHLQFRVLFNVTILHWLTS